MTKPHCCPSCEAPRPAPLDGAESVTCGACGWVQVFNVDLAPIRAALVEYWQGKAAMAREAAEDAEVMARTVRFLNDQDALDEHRRRCGAAGVATDGAQR